MAVTAEEAAAAYDSFSGGGGNFSFSPDDAAEAYDSFTSSRREAPYLEAIGSRLKAVPYQLIKSESGIASAIEDNLPSFFDPLKVDPEERRGRRQWAQSEIDQLYGQSYVKPGTLKSGFVEAPAALAKYAIPLATGTILPFIGAETFGNKYPELNEMEDPDTGERQMSPGSAAGVSLADAYLNSKLAALPLNTAFGSGSLLSKAVFTPLELQLQSLGSQAIKYLEDKGITGKSDLTIQDVKDRAVESAGMAPLFVAAGGFSNRPKKITIENLPEFGQEVTPDGAPSPSPKLLPPSPEAVESNKTVSKELSAGQDASFPAPLSEVVGKASVGKDLDTRTIPPKTDQGSAGLPSAETALYSPDASLERTNSSPSSSRYTPEASSIDIMNSAPFSSHYESIIPEKSFVDNFAKELAQGNKVETRVKDKARAAQKVWEKINLTNKTDYNETNLGDLIGTKIVAKNLSEARSIISNLKKEGQIVPGTEEDYFERPTDLGYEGWQANFVTPNGAKFEVQIHTPWSDHIRSVARKAFVANRGKGVPLTDEARQISRLEVAKAKEEWFKKHAPEELRKTDLNLYQQGDVQKSLVPYPVKEIGNSEIVARPELMQFKASDAPATGTNKEDRISGEWDRLKAGNLLLWEPKNPAEHGLGKGERYVVANGHHRLEKGKELNVPSFSSQILREVDGVSAQEARRTAAEINIADGKGTIFDQVKFLSNLKDEIGSVEAIKRAANLGVKGKTPADIGIKATPELIGLFHARKITPEAAAAIADGAPMSPELQQEGIKEYLKDPKISPNVLRNLVSDPELVTALTMGGPGDLFGNRDSANEAAKARSKAADKLELEDASRARLVKTNAKMSDIARQENIKIKDPAALKKRGKSLSDDAERWKNWRQHPDLVERVNKEVIQSSGILNNERGSIITPFSGFNLGAKIKDVIQRTVNAPEEIDYLLSKAEEGDGSITGVKPDPSTSYFEGRIFNKNLPILSTLAKARRTYISRPIALAKKFPEAREAWDAQKERWKDRESNTFDIYQQGKEYFDLTDKTRVNRALITARMKSREAIDKGNRYVVTPESLKAQGFSPDEVNAYVAARRMLDYSWDMLGQRMLEAKKYPGDPAKQIAWENDVKKYFAEQKDQNYVPYNRFGDLFVYAEKPGESPWYSLHEKVDARNKAAVNLKNRGFQVRVGKMRPIAQEGYNGLPRDMVMDLAKLIPDKEAHDEKALPINGFKGHLLRADLVQGFEGQLERSMAEYVQGVSSYMAKLRYEPKMKEALAKVDPQKRPLLYDTLSRWDKYVNSNNAEGQWLKGMFAHYYLGFLNPKSAFVNATQPLTTLYPELSKYSKQPMKELTQAVKLGIKYQNSPVKFAKDYPELFQALKELERRGTIGNDITRDLSGARKGLPNQPRTWSDVSMMAFSTVEKYNHLFSAIAGMNVAPKDMPFMDKVKFAEKMDEQANFLYNKLNRPEIARGWKSPFFTFRNFGLNYLGQLKDNIGEKQWGAVIRMIGPMITLGGIAALPGMKETMGALIAAGYDPKKKIREELPSNYMADLLLYGLPFMGGINISGAVGPGELAPDFEAGAGPAFSRYIAGVPLGTAQRIGKAMYNYEMTGKWDRTIEPLLPEGLRNPAVAYRAWKEKGFRDPRGIAVMKDPTAGELAAKTLGFTPSRLSRAYERQTSIENLQEQIKDESSGYNAKIARALEFGDKARVKDLIQEMTAKGIAPDMDSINQRRGEIKNLDYGNIQGTPKRGRAKLGELMRIYKRR